eukprot:TRINITY_DN6351_c0_g1_i1.p1 TRINITY_DN6351_c0_g1~~TRINITY_DN6351_c0_g1_i1.p1  ORF type:complete len:884 (-),score=190.74 TRINITY_DN6351_c0_g1_i1:49-2700(-)
MAKRELPEKEVQSKNVTTESKKSDTFGFPHLPYPLQTELMMRVYNTLESGGVGVLESPTGTGKTLSLLCPALAWLQRRELSLMAESLAPSGLEDETEDWAREHHRANARAVADLRWRRRRHCREQRRLRVSRAMALTSSGSLQRDKFRRVAAPLHQTASQAFTSEVAPELALEMELSLEAPPVLPRPEDFPGRMPQLAALLTPEPEEEAWATQEAFEGKTQIIFCSRTHTQLAQVLREIRSIQEEVLPEGLSVVTLGARSNLCVNDAVRARARGAGHLNDLCRLATERSGSGAASSAARAAGLGLSCMLKKQAQTMTDAILAEMMDIETMAQRGRAPVGGGCPYYGSRRAVHEADVLLVPYASLVNSETRKKLGIQPEGKVLIFDEAHNLLEAISEANSVGLTASQARNAVDDLDLYAGRYEARLAPGNAMRLRQLRQLCTQLHRLLGGLGRPCAQTVGAFLVSLGADHFDLPELSRFLEVTELARKVRGFAESRAAEAARGAKASSGNSSSVYAIAELLGALQGSSCEDRIICQPADRNADGSEACLRYLSLDAEARFRELLAPARAVIFAGGTLEPRAEFAPLYATAPVEGAHVKERIVHHFSGRHVVPPAHIFARYITHGPGGHSLDFRKDMRNTAAMISEVRAIMAATAAATPGGIVFFFPSFEYLSVFAASDPGLRIGGRSVFVESRSVSGDSEGTKRRPAELKSSESGEANILVRFATKVREEGGALLLAVSGGKLSEGIDFKDQLCRLVVVVGLPYPNASDLALLEKMRFLDASRSRGLPGLTGREFYTARCMKAVNQCIGRSIRHAKDWAAILLLDHRYAQPAINGSISRWLSESACASEFTKVQQSLDLFFAERHQEVEGPQDSAPSSQEALSQ